MTSLPNDADEAGLKQAPAWAAHRPARASVRMSLGNARFQADAEITPIGLLAIGGMVGGILLALAPVVSAATSKRRR